MNKRFRNILIVVAVTLVIGSCVFMFSISPVKIKTGNREMPEANGSTDEITQGIVIAQSFENITEDIKEIAVVFNRLYYLDEKCDINIELLNGEQVLASKTYDADSIEGSHRTYLYPNEPLSDLAGKELTLRIYSPTTWGTGLSVMVQNDSSNSTYTFGNKLIKGTICFSITGE